MRFPSILRLHTENLQEIKKGRIVEENKLTTRGETGGRCLHCNRSYLTSAAFWKTSSPFGVLLTFAEKY
jgi:hypothetical protein